MKKSIDLLLKAFLANEPKEDAEYFHNKDLWIKLLRVEKEANSGLRAECGLVDYGTYIDPWCFADGNARKICVSDVPYGPTAHLDLFSETNKLYAEAINSGVAPRKGDKTYWDVIRRWRIEKCIHVDSRGPTHSNFIHQTIAAWINSEQIEIYDPDEGEEVFCKKALKNFENWGGYQLDERYLVDLDEIRNFLLSRLGTLPTSLYPEHESNTRNMKSKPRMKQKDKRQIPKECRIFAEKKMEEYEGHSKKRAIVAYLLNEKWKYPDLQQFQIGLLVGLYTEADLKHKKDHSRLRKQTIDAIRKGAKELGK